MNDSNQPDTASGVFSQTDLPNLTHKELSGL